MYAEMLNTSDKFSFDAVIFTPNESVSDDQLMQPELLSISGVCSPGANFLRQRFLGSGDITSLEKLRLSYFGGRHFFDIIAIFRVYCGGTLQPENLPKFCNITPSNVF